MAKTRVQLQVATETGTGTTQAPEFAARVGNGKSGLFVLNVFKNVPGGTFTVQIDHATSASQPGGANISTWANAGQLSLLSMLANGTGAQSLFVTGLADLVRWRISAHPAGAVAWEIVAYFWDT